MFYMSLERYFTEFQFVLFEVKSMQKCNVKLNIKDFIYTGPTGFTAICFIVSLYMNLFYLLINTE